MIEMASQSAMSAAMPNALAALSGVTLRYNGTTALDEVSLNLTRGAVIGLVGRNGAGKSSLIRCLLGLTRPGRGSVALFGEDPREMSDAVRARIGYVPQSPDLIEWMSVGRHLDYIGAFYEQWDEQRVEQWRRDWELDKDARVAGLSQGQKQKLSLLLALGHDPKLLLLDEPVASFDPLMRREFMRALFDAAPDRTVLISSHLLSDLERVISHLVLMHDGRIVIQDEWDTLNENLRRVVTAVPMQPQPGVLARRRQNEGHVAVIDLRQFKPESAGAAGLQMMAMNLDELFVELLS